jgi:hypothetical protein
VSRSAFKSEAAASFRARRKALVAAFNYLTVACDGQEVRQIQFQWLAIFAKVEARQSGDTMISALMRI